MSILNAVLTRENDFKEAILKAMVEHYDDIDGIRLESHPHLRTDFIHGNHLVARLSCVTESLKIRFHVQSQYQYILDTVQRVNEGVI